MSTPLIIQINPYHRHQLATSNINGQSAEAQLAQQQTLIFNQTLEIIEEQENAIQAEYVNALHLAQNTISNLQIAQQALLQQNALQTAQITVLQSQNHQSETAHKTDMKASQELNDLLKKENDRLKATVAIYEKAFVTFDTANNSFKSSVCNTKYTCVNPAWPPFNPWCTCYPVRTTIDSQVTETKKQLLEQLKEKT